MTEWEEHHRTSLKLPSQVPEPTKIEIWIFRRGPETHACSKSLSIVLISICQFPLSKSLFSAGFSRWLTHRSHPQIMWGNSMSCWMPYDDFCLSKQRTVAALQPAFAYFSMGKQQCGCFDPRNRFYLQQRVRSKMQMTVTWYSRSSSETLSHRITEIKKKLQRMQKKKFKT